MPGTLKIRGMVEQVYRQSPEPIDYRYNTQEEPGCWSRKVFGGNVQTKARWISSQGCSVVSRFGEGSTGTKAQKAQHGNLFSIFNIVNIFPSSPFNRAYSDCV